MADVANYNIEDASGANVRIDLNNVFGAIQSNNSKTTDLVDSQCVSGMTFLNTTSKIFKIRNSANNDFTDIGHIDQANLGLLPRSGGTSAEMTGQFVADDSTSESAPAITFHTNTNTGFYRSAVNEIGVSNNGTNTATFKPFQLDIAGYINVQHPSAGSNIQISSPAAGHDSYVDLAAHNTQYTDYGLRVSRQDGENGVSQLVHRGTGNFEISTNEASNILIKTNNVNAWIIDNQGKLNWALNGVSGVTIPSQSGYLAPRGIISRRGINQLADQSNGYNFYWDDVNDPDHLEAWIDTVHVGDVTLATSDYRIKRNINLQTESGINKIKNLKPVTYQFADYNEIFKSKDDIREGFIAHEVQEVIPSAVNRDKDVENALQTLNLDAIVSVLTKALQEAVAKIETLETKVAALEGS